MKKIIGLFLATIILITPAIQAKQNSLDNFAQQYFTIMTATQAPNADAKVLEAYLALLHDDVGHSYLPWVTDDSRLADGKASMRKGMTFYLGAHDKYESELLHVFTFNDSAVAIRYKQYAKGIHPESGETIE